MRTINVGKPTHEATPPGRVDSALDLERLDAEATADAESWSRPKAIFLGVRRSAPAGVRNSGERATSVVPARSMFQRMIDSFFGVTRP